MVEGKKKKGGRNEKMETVHGGESHYKELKYQSGFQKKESEH